MYYLIVREQMCCFWGCPVCMTSDRSAKSLNNKAKQRQCFRSNEQTRATDAAAAGLSRRLRQCATHAPNKSHICAANGAAAASRRHRSAVWMQWDCGGGGDGGGDKMSGWCDAEAAVTAGWLRSGQRRAATLIRAGTDSWLTSGRWLALAAAAAAVRADPILSAGPMNAGDDSSTSWETVYRLMRAAHANWSFRPLSAPRADWKSSNSNTTFFPHTGAPQSTD